MRRFTGSKLPKSKAPAAVVHPGTGIRRTTFTNAGGSAIWPRRIPPKTTNASNTTHTESTVFFIDASLGVGRPSIFNEKAPVQYFLPNPRIALTAGAQSNNLSGINYDASDSSV